MDTERTQLSERASGKMRRAIGRVLEGESREELERIAAEDERLAHAGLVKLKRGERVFYKHIDDLAPEDRRARIAAERGTIVWLKGRIVTERVAAMWRERGWDRPRRPHPSKDERSRHSGSRHSGI
ncbi:MAG: hypothetical protein ACJ73W_11750 [Rubrobacteraceae bacterium]